MVHFINYVIYRKLAVAFITVERTAVYNVNIHWSQVDYRYFNFSNTNHTEWYFYCVSAVYLTDVNTRS